MKIPQTLAIQNTYKYHLLFPFPIHKFSHLSLQSSPPVAMAISHNFLLFSSLLLTIMSASFAQPSFRPKALVLPVSKDASSLQYTTQIHQRTPLVPVKLTVDLGGQYIWVDCDHGYVSSSFKPVYCGTAQCSLTGSKSCIGCAPQPGCERNRCGLSPYNSVTRTSTSGEVRADVLSLPSTDGKNPGRVVSIPQYIFSCAPTFLLQGLASGVVGMAGLGRNKISLPSLSSAAFSFDRKFGICLSSSSSNGVIFLGDGPYNFLPNVEISGALTYTPLITNPVSTAGSYFQGEPSYEYFIGVKSINIGGKKVPLNTTLLSIDSNGYGGTKISTVNPYTVVETSIYNAVVAAFVKGLNATRVAAVAPFGACFNRKNIPSTRVGPGVPLIELVLQSESVKWYMYGANSMVFVSEEVVCLGFVDGGLNPRTSIVIGGHQLEDNFLQFDLATSRLGFSSSLSFYRTTCSNFNFTSNA